MNHPPPRYPDAPRGAGASRRSFHSAPPPQSADPWDGVLYVDKPAGPTSHDIVESIRRRFGFKKVGHGGTLDPQATGLLILLIGRGTKLSMGIIGMDKVYEGTIRLGVATDSHDADGEVTREGDCSGVTSEAVQAEMKKLTGDLMQVPPMVSAVKKDGVPLYKRARKGEEVEREPRLIHIYEFSLTDFRLPDADFRVRCTKGTYVRKLCADIGDALGCGAHLSRLRRTEIGRVRIEEALPLDTLLAMGREELVSKIIPLRSLVAASHESLH
jgi:tRNA pseudouridine55 synthase